MARAVLKGIPVSPGIAIGPLLSFPENRLCEKRRITSKETGQEIALLEKASQQVCAKLQTTIQSMPDSLAEYRDLIAAQMELARDSKILNGAKARIRARHICASWALAETIEEMAGLFLDMSDPYLAERAQDIRTVGRTLEECLGEDAPVDKSGNSGILAGRDLAAGELIAKHEQKIRGIITSEGGPTSHMAIMARGLKIPAVVGLSDLFKTMRPGEDIIMDGLTGMVLLSPDEADTIYYNYRKENYEAFEEEARASARKRARTKDGQEISIYANIDNPFELQALESYGAEGIGLYRTEYAWLGESLPDEEMLFNEYRNVARQAPAKTITFRTLDLGADKLLYGQDRLREPNPALGLRGIRFCLQRKDLFRIQLRAILRASTNVNAAIMLPMVTNIQEIEETRHLLNEIRHELRKNHIPHAENLPLGIMVETPAAIMICDYLADNCDFISLGTNDLLHYLLAIDRNNRHVAYLHEPLHPAFTRSIKQAIDAAHNLGHKVSVCGELASDPFGMALLLGMGVDRLSAAPHFIPGMKHMMRRLDASLCANLAKLALNGKDVMETRNKLHTALSKALGAELDFHNSFIMDNYQ